MNGALVLYCTCPGGQKEYGCKHCRALLEGRYSKLVRWRERAAIKAIFKQRKEDARTMLRTLDILDAERDIIQEMENEEPKHRRRLRAITRERYEVLTAGRRETKPVVPLLKLRMLWRRAWRFVPTTRGGCCGCLAILGILFFVFFVPVCNEAIKNMPPPETPIITPAMVTPTSPPDPTPEPTPKKKYKTPVLPETLVINGKTYKGVKASGRDDTTVSFMHNDGVATVAINDLPEAVREGLE